MNRLKLGGKSDIMDKSINDRWFNETTLGGKSKPFLWKIDDGGNIHIKRKFNLENGEKDVEKVVNANDLNRLDEYMADGKWKDLANNVQKLANGKEKPGIGKFLYDELGWTTTDAQLSSHLGVIFYRSKVWDYNEKMRGMQFKRISSNWCEKVKNYYEKYKAEE